MESIYDAIVIGGGPGGTTTASYLARSGRKVLLLEKEIFPRFHIGESLLPYNQRIFKEMGLLPALEAAGFPKKKGAQFHLGNGAKNIQLVFRQGAFTREPEAFQVERATFDDLLFKHAATAGADCRQGWTVGSFEQGAGEVSVQARGPSGEECRFRGKFLIDASGRNNFTGNLQGLRVIHPDLKKLAIFGHFHGVQVDPGDKAGDTIIVRMENKWFWLIPLSGEKVSVGCVMDGKEFAALKEAPEKLFERLWRSSPPMVERMSGAARVGPIHTTSDFSYYNRQLTGHRLLRVGDAAGFMDPIFSAGVYLAMYSGKLAAACVDQALTAGTDGSRGMVDYEKRVWRGMRFYWEMVEQFYTTPFMEVFLEPREKFRLASAVNAALAGEVDGGWGMHWRMRLFFQIVRLQKRFPLLPRISWS